jgi:hypothetical protein
MFSRVFIWTADFERALAFYEALMSLLGIAQRFCDRSRPWAAWQMPGQARPLFLVDAPIEGERGHGSLSARLAPQHRESASRLNPTSCYPRQCQPLS